MPQLEGLNLQTKSTHPLQNQNNENNIPEPILLKYLNSKDKGALQNFLGGRERREKNRLYIDELLRLQSKSEDLSSEAMPCII